MAEDPPNHERLRNERDEPQPPATAGTGEHVKAEAAAHQLRPALPPGRRRLPAHRGIPTRPDSPASLTELHGYDDPMATPEHVLAIAKELSDARTDWQLHAYGGTAHAFINPHANVPERGLMYDETADRRSWIALRNFLEEVLA